MIKNIEKKNKTELVTLESEMLVSLRNFRFGMAGSKSRNLKEGKNLGRDIARVKTALKKINDK